jgi:hypothetical protein
MLKNQRVTFVSSVEEAEQHSPFRMSFNPVSSKYVVRDGSNVKAAGMEKDEAEACVMFCANEYIYRSVQEAGV